MMGNLQMVGCFNITRAVEQFDKLVKSIAQYTTKYLCLLKCEVKRNVNPCNISDTRRLLYIENDCIGEVRLKNLNCWLIIEL